MERLAAVVAWPLIVSVYTVYFVPELSIKPFEGMAFSSIYCPFCPYGDLLGGGGADGAAGNVGADHDEEGSWLSVLGFGVDFCTVFSIHVRFVRIDRPV